MSSESIAANAVGFLRAHDRHELERMRGAYTGTAERALLDEELAPVSPLLKAQLEITVAALNAFLATWNERSAALRARLERAGRWSFWGAVIATLGSGSALSLMLGKASGLAVPLAAAVGLAGGLIGLIEKFLRRDLYGGDNALTDRMRDLSAGAATASAYIRQFMPHLQSDDAGEDPEALKDALRRANEHIGQMQALLDALPSLSR
ncbi:hypothetical protein [Lysobacter silvisoli]|uniref:Uncharacterized protein n=1 Tax=Lysobacter silvisoli TaxID=2293254 RepID=A0A371K5Z6_9GAMM|nr:hypothetical protein [Lysobacter silvisoli]RDZ29308.1 hypothetical protein DX914_09560 [Lysobacter silvisoli]